MGGPGIVVPIIAATSGLAGATVGVAASYVTQRWMHQHEVVDADRRWRRDVALQHATILISAMTRAQLELVTLATATDEDYVQTLIGYGSLSREAGEGLMDASIPLSKSTLDLAHAWFNSISKARKAIMDAKDERGRVAAAEEHVDGVAACGRRCREAARVELGFAAPARPSQ